MFRIRPFSQRPVTFNTVCLIYNAQPKLVSTTITGASNGSKLKPNIISKILLVILIAIDVVEFHLKYSSSVCMQTSYLLN